MADELEPEVAAVFDEFWAPIVCSGGEWDLDQVKRELHDYHTCITEVPKVYSHVTHGMLSKPNYLASEVIRVHDERCPLQSDMREMAKRIRRVLPGLDQTAHVGDDASILVSPRDLIEEIIADYLDDECL